MAKINDMQPEAIAHPVNALAIQQDQLDHEANGGGLGTERKTDSNNLESPPVLGEAAIVSRLGTPAPSEAHSDSVNVGSEISSPSVSEMGVEGLITPAMRAIITEAVNKKTEQTESRLTELINTAIANLNANVNVRLDSLNTTVSSRLASLKETTGSLTLHPESDPESGSILGYPVGRSDPVLPQFVDIENGDKLARFCFNVGGFQDINISTENNNIVVSAKRRDEQEDQQFRKFRRTVAIPQGMQLEQMKARLAPNDMLTIEAPYTPPAIQQQQHREIPITHEPARK